MKVVTWEIVTYESSKIQCLTDNWFKRDFLKVVSYIACEQAYLFGVLRKYLGGRVTEERLKMQCLTENWFKRDYLKVLVYGDDHVE